VSGIGRHQSRNSQQGFRGYPDQCSSRGSTSRSKKMGRLFSGNSLKSKMTRVKSRLRHKIGMILCGSLWIWDLCVGPTPSRSGYVNFGHTSLPIYRYLRYLTLNLRLKIGILHTPIMRSRLAANGMPKRLAPSARPAGSRKFTIMGLDSRSILET
jgi:hypothetical protein